MYCSASRCITTRMYGHPRLTSSYAILAAFLLILLSPSLSHASQCTDFLSKCVLKGLSSDSIPCFPYLAAGGVFPSNFGNRQQCLSTNATYGSSMYCVGTVNTDPSANVPVGKIPCSNSIPGCMLAWCIPSNCTTADVRGILAPVLSLMTSSYTVVSSVEVRCSASPRDGGGPESETPLSKGAIATIFILSFLGALVGASTIYEWWSRVTIEDEAADDYQSQRGEVFLPLTDIDKALAASTNESSSNADLSTSNRFLACFSLFKNCEKLFDTQSPLENSPTEFLNGLRTLSMFWVILGHTVFFAVVFGIDNPAYLFGDVVKRWSMQFIINASVSVDSFFFIGGFLCAYLALPKVSLSIVFWLKFIIYRMLRMWPVYMLTIAFYTTIIPYLGGNDSPFYYRHLDSNCNDNWWTNILFINNLYPAELMNQCMGWSWYIGLDMQLYILVTPPLLLLYRYGGIWIGHVFSLILCVVTMTAYGIYAKNDSMSVSVSSPSAQGQTDTYEKPWTRAAPYVLGIALAASVRHWPTQLHRTSRRPGRVSTFIAFLLHGIAIGLFLASLLPERDSADWSPLSNQIYISFQRFTWSIGLTLLSFAQLGGYHLSPVYEILTLRCFRPLGKLTFAAYLCHPIVMTTYYYSRVGYIHYDDGWFAMMFCSFSVVSYGIAVLMALFVEAPFLQLQKLFLGGGGST